MTTIGTSPIGDKDWVGHVMSLQRDIRGGILEAAIRVERTLDLVLANHFCESGSERWWQLYSLVLIESRLLFRRKCDIVLELLETVYPDLSSGYPKLKKDLERIVDMRNKVAHLEPMVPSGFGTGKLPDHIILTRYRRGKRETSKLTRTHAKEVEQDANCLFKQLSEIALGA